MLPDWVSNPGPLTYESGALPIALCGPVGSSRDSVMGNMLDYQSRDCKVDPLPLCSFE